MNMKRRWISKAIKIALLLALAVLVFGYIVMSLWNWLVPSLFGWSAITFWQALGLLLLCKILFGGWHGRPHGGGHWRRRMAERWTQMTPEEREKFRDGIRARCRHFEPPSTDAKS